MINSIKYCILVLALVGFVTVPALALTSTVTHLKTVTMQEIFKDVPGYEGIYQVSNLGRVKSLERIDSNNHPVKERILKASDRGHGYLSVSLANGGIKYKRVHQLVAMAFLNHIPNGYMLVCDHINNIKNDNRLSNIRIITNRENTNLKHIKSSSQFTGVSWEKKNHKWRARIQINGKDKNLGMFTNEIEASEAYQNKLATLNTKLL